MPSTRCWTGRRGAMERVLADLLCAELRRLRPGGPPPPPAWSWSAATRLDEGGPVGADSLELLALATAAAELTGAGGEGLLAGTTLGGWCARLRAAGGTGRVVFRTSGSTGAPRRCAHALADLEAEAAALAGLLGAGRTRVLSAVPLHHAYGFIHGVLLPARLGGPPGPRRTAPDHPAPDHPAPDRSELDRPPLDLRPHAPGALAALLRPGDLVLGHPAWWQALADAAPAPLPPDVVGVTSTAPCPPALARAVLGTGLARLVQVYGSSETAGLGWRDDPDGPFALLPGWARDGEGLRRAGGDAVEAPDLLAWEGEGRFRVAGRRDGAVQVGGVNVHPARVREALLAHPAVADAAVRPMLPAEGGRLKAFVVPAPGAPADAALRDALQAHAAARLSAPERPRAWSFGPALPVGEMGKPADWPAG